MNNYNHDIASNIRHIQLPWPPQTFRDTHGARNPFTPASNSHNFVVFVRLVDANFMANGNGGHEHSVFRGAITENDNCVVNTQNKCDFKYAFYLRRGTGI